MIHFFKKYKNNIFGFCFTILGLSLFIGIFMHIVPIRHNQIEPPLLETLGKSLKYVSIICFGVTMFYYGICLMSKHEWVLELNRDFINALTPDFKWFKKMKTEVKSKIDVLK